MRLKLTGKELCHLGWDGPQEPDIAALVRKLDGKTDLTADDLEQLQIEADNLATFGADDTATAKRIIAKIEKLMEATDA